MTNSSRKFNEDPLSLIETFNSLLLSIKESMGLLINKIDDSNVEIVYLMFKLYMPMCEYNLNILIEDIFEVGRRNEIIEIKYLYLDIIKEMDRRINEMNKKDETSVIKIEAQSEEGK